MAGVPAIFDCVARGRHRDRAAQSGLIELEAYVADALIDRVAMVSRDFATALVVNSGHGVLASALRDRRIIVTETDYGSQFSARVGVIRCEEDSIPLTRPFDLVIAAAGFETIDDLPGALIAARRVLNSGGLFLAAMFGSPSLPVLRAAFADAQRDSDRHVARFHPEIDVRSAGDLLPRAGFTLPVADIESVALSYTSLDRLIGDLRATGNPNALARRHPLTRGERGRAQAAFAAIAGPDGRTIETASLIMMTGWAA